MGRRTTMLLGALAVTSPAHAERLELGAYAGRASTNIYTSYECPPPSGLEVCVSGLQPNQGANGASVGVSLQYSLASWVSLEADVLYVQKGYKVSPRVRFHYVETPLLVRLDPLRGRSPARIFVHAGIAPAVRAGCSASGTAFNNDTHMAYAYSGSCDDSPFPPTPSRYDLGFVFGAGAGWDFSFGTLEVQLRAVRSLVDIDDADPGVTTNRASYVLVGFSRTVGSL